VVCPCVCSYQVGDVRHSTQQQHGALHVRPPRDEQARVAVQARQPLHLAAGEAIQRQVVREHGLLALGARVQLEARGGTVRDRERGCSDEKVANRNAKDFGREIAHGAGTRRPPISLYTMIPRTGGYAHDVGVWELSIVQGPFSVAPCQTRYDSQLFHRCRGGEERWVSVVWTGLHLEALLWCGCEGVVHRHGSLRVVVAEAFPQRAERHTQQAHLPRALR
jgi:hypothetical protein